MRDRICPCGNYVPRGVNGNRKWCDSCLEYRTNIGRYRVDHPKLAKAYQRAYDRYRATGFTADMFAECWKIQAGKCGHCRIELSTLKSSHIHADHEPKSTPPKPRGILCRRCNVYWLGVVEKLEREGRVMVLDPEVIEWQTNPPMSGSSFAEEIGWLINECNNGGIFQ